MARPIWTGTLSFGLLNIPIKLMTGERRVDLHFRMLDSRNNAPIRYERVNAETGEEVPWKEIVKAFEYDKGSYVVLEEGDIQAASPDHKETVDIDTFVDADAIGPEFYEKPYVLEPGKKAEKGYVLLREVLKRTRKVGIGRVVIRTREYLAAVMPRGDALQLVILRFAQELVDPEEYKLPEGKLDKWKISARELEMAQQLIESMSSEWKPDAYQDDFRERLQKVIEKRIRGKQTVRTPAAEEEGLPENAATNVIDFGELLKRSLEKKGAKPAAKTPARPPAKRAARKGPAKKRGSRSSSAS
ncbi:Ku protein [Vulcaniibacterium tengchongense]|uniref:Non-homologous end joining protein Ku n=1 Tax=Vulcaniibacterium tengchongense TaxID=1273429 RepID=A0A3N4VA47_9GAMM|nr:Ku protein [Vulcaniibacterium tengchongense]RPE79862.1 DNA end-binding protein Ku [Vulcaniibacterium tengchongense]